MESGLREGLPAGNGGRGCAGGGDAGQPEGGGTAGRTEGGDPERLLAHRSHPGQELRSDGAWPGRGVACGHLPPPPSAPAAARPAGVRSARAAEPRPSLGRPDSAMASLSPLLCLLVAAAHLAGARGEAPPDPSPGP